MGAGASAAGAPARRRRSDARGARRRSERKQLIIRTPDPVDTRAKRLRVTDQGCELAVRAITVVEAADDEFFAPVPRGEAIQMLARLASEPQDATKLRLES